MSSQLSGAELVQAAADLARRAHDGQLDKAGRPYAAHPARVAARLAGDPVAAAAGWLHDVVEDTDVTAEDLLSQGFPPEVVEVVELLTSVDEVPLDDYYRAIRAHPVALRVKLADLADNDDPQRLATLDPAMQDRLRAKYAHARAVLTGKD